MLKLWKKEIYVTYVKTVSRRWFEMACTFKRWRSFTRYASQK